MHIVRSNVDDIARIERPRLIAIEHFSLAFEDIDFMLVRMIVVGRVSTRLQLELTHRKIRRTIRLA